MYINLINMGEIVGINILVAFLCFLFGYLMGSIPTAVWIGKVFFHKDPREYGSKNAGGTNAGRLFGKKVGVTVIILDMLKSIAPIWISWAILTFVPMIDGKPLLMDANAFLSGQTEGYVITWSVYWLTGLGCIIGHCYPIFAQFRGGKGFSSYMGLICVTSWFYGIIVAATYFPILKWKKYVSLCAITTCVGATVLSWVLAVLHMTHCFPPELGNFGMYGMTLICDWPAALIITLMSGIVVYRHKGNIQRLVSGNERKITWMK